MDKIKIQIQEDHDYGCRGIVWNANDAIRIRKEFRLIGSFIGTLNQFPLQNTCLGLPFTLSNEEVILVCHEFCEQVEFATDIDWIRFICEPETNRSITDITATVSQNVSIKSGERYAIFHDFWKQGYFITTGVKYGADFAIYNADPLTIHAEYIVSIFSENEHVSGQHLASLGRVSHSVKKSHLLVYWDSSSNQVQSIVLTRSKC